MAGYRRYSTKVALVVAAIAIVAGILMVVLNRNQATEITTPTNTSGVEIKLPKAWRLKEISQADHDAGVVAQAVRTKPDAQVSLRTVARDANDATNINELPTIIAEALEAELDGIKIVDKQVASFGKYQAAQIQYRYTIPGDPTKYEYEMWVVLLSDQVFYTTYRAEISDLKTVEPQFAAINKSVAASIAAQDK